MFKKYGIPVFVLLLAAHCASILAELPTARLVTKLLLVPVLMVYLFASLPARRHAVSPVAPLVALFFSFLGDLFLTQPGQDYFLLGMGAFIITHISNSIYFIKLWGGPSWKSVPAFVAASILVASVKMIYDIFKDNLGAFKAPILVYMAIISFMGMFAAGSVTHPVYGRIGLRWIVPGAALFIASDAMLALDKFHFHEPAVWSVPVMLTYGLAQCLLTIGVSRQQNIEQA